MYLACMQHARSMQRACRERAQSVRRAKLRYKQLLDYEYNSNQFLMTAFVIINQKTKFKVASLLMHNMCALRAH